MSECVLDSSAVLAYLQREPGYKAVGAMLERAAISTVNVAEIATKLTERGALRIQEAIQELDVQVIDFDEDLSYRVAALRPATRVAGLSLGDRACLATAQRLGVRAITTDQNWSRVQLDVEIQVIR
ncbi:MAG: type II toxin-antitoxin system VapC family toxin [Acidobacteria bacterium]|nr:type II toxin-antitoxin system VapC family toxin [Acidobacteriota bacterium]